MPLCLPHCRHQHALGAPREQGLTRRLVWREGGIPDREEEEGSISYIAAVYQL